MMRLRSSILSAVNGGRRALSHAGLSWFALTGRERIAALIVLGIFLIGLTARAWLHQT
jgi:hypothetical protein